MTLIKWDLPKYSMSHASQPSMPPSTGGQVGDLHIPPAQLLSPFFTTHTGAFILLGLNNTSFQNMLSN